MKRRRTLTLVEILVMLAIIGLIAGLLLPNLHKKHQRALRNSAST
jgi:type II secretory pathway pseudopilin PulG